MKIEIDTIRVNNKLYFKAEHILNLVKDVLFLPKDSLHQFISKILDELKKHVNEDYK